AFHEVVTGAHAVLPDLVDPCERFLVGREATLRPLPLGDVAADLRRPDDRTVRVRDRRDGERHVAQRAVLPATDRLEVIDALGPPEAGEDLALLVQAIRRDDEIDPLPDRFGGRIAEDALRARVPARDDAVERLADDGVVRGLDDRREQRTHLLGAGP